MRSRWKTVLWVAGSLLLAAALSLAGLEALIRWEAAGTADRAARRFGGDRIAGLVRLVDCESCALAERNRAVWALGQLGDTRALPALERHHTGGPCHHELTLCQYELDKAIRKIRGTWGVMGRLLKARAASEPAPQ